MTEYEGGLPVRIAYPPDAIRNCLAEVVSRSGGHQFHVAETEKYAHVTYFINGGQEHPFEGEDRKLIPSRKDVPTYDTGAGDERAADHRRGGRADREGDRRR